jgi:hypothetical protein
MHKIPTLFVRDPNDRAHVLPEVTLGCEWVLAGEGIPTKKYDGTCVMYDGITWWARREVKEGKPRPPFFREVETNLVTGKTVGWEPYMQSSFAKYLDEAVENSTGKVGGFTNVAGTYELIGPKINGNPEQVNEHLVVAHGCYALMGVPTDYDGLRAWLQDFDGEGIVWWHKDDGRMVKLKRKDFA